MSSQSGLETSRDDEPSDNNIPIVNHTTQYQRYTHTEWGASNDTNVVRTACDASCYCSQNVWHGMKSINVIVCIGTYSSLNPVKYFCP